MIPIFPCIGWSSTGHPYNISSNEIAAILSLTRIFVLTTQASDWFLQLGFEQGEVKELP